MARSPTSNWIAMLSIQLTLWNSASAKSSKVNDRIGCNRSPSRDLLSAGPFFALAGRIAGHVPVVYRDSRITPGHKDLAERYRSRFVAYRRGTDRLRRWRSDI